MTNNPSIEPVQTVSANYNDLKFYFANLNTMFSIRDTLATDMMTDMPAGGLHRRIQEISSLTKRIYAETTTPAVTGLLDKVESEAENTKEDWNKWDLANLKEMRRIHNHLSALPPELYIASVQISNEGRKMHAAAMQSKNWQNVIPYVQKVVDTYKKIGELKQNKFNTETPYRALLIGYASDIDDRQMDDLYEGLLAPLKDLLTKAIDKQNMDELPLPLKGEFTRKDQMWLNKTILELMGFDFQRGHLAISSLNPMTGGHPDDTRVLVRCNDETSFLDSMEDTLYQGARAIYNQNLPTDWKTQPVGQDQGMIMMNTMSILFETIIGRMPQFFEFVSSRAEGVFRQFKNDSFSAENLYRLRKVIHRTNERNEADELTKIFHDILRYRIERDLMNGTLAVKDLEERWNEESKELLGETPKDITQGVLQNPDWFTGRIGFIPTNTLSHIMAAEVQDVLYQTYPSMINNIAEGNFEDITSWLKTNIFEVGRLEGTFDTMTRLTGQDISPEPLITHLKRRYLSEKR
ncbi:MAG: hypothetical protein AAF549_02935 [Pseudomonadota bacterium]